MSLAVAILMKDPADAKTRLAPAVGRDARAAIALAMFENTLAFFADFVGTSQLAVATGSPRIAAIARAAGAEAVAECEGGIDGAATAAARWARDRRASSLLIVHADMPALVRDEFERLIAAGVESDVVIGESVDGGTNALLVTPPDAIAFAFGAGSAAAHAVAARARGLSCARLLLANLSRDLDTPADLAACLSAPADRSGVVVRPVPGIPDIRSGDDLGGIVAAAIAAARMILEPGDIVVVAQKIVSKAEGRMVALSGFAPSPRARRIADEIGKDPRKVEAILSESADILRARRSGPDGLIVARHRQGWICANAGIDESNLGPAGAGMLLLLPEDADRSARAIRAALEARFAGPIGVIVTDTFGRPWRHGLVNVAIGVAGVPALDDWIGRADAYGRKLAATLPAFADECAAAAGLSMGKDASLPVVVLRGLRWRADPASRARDVLRPLEQELFL